MYSIQISQVISLLVWKSNQKENNNKNLLSSVKILTLIDWKSLQSQSIMEATSTTGNSNSTAQGTLLKGIVNFFLFIQLETKNTFYKQCWPWFPFKDYISGKILYKKIQFYSIFFNVVKPCQGIDGLFIQSCSDNTYFLYSEHQNTKVNKGGKSKNPGVQHFLQK